ncbi:hypothetical protein [Sphingomonas sp. IW22]
MIPTESEIEQLCKESGMGRMQAIYHLRARAKLRRSHMARRIYVI